MRVPSRLVACLALLAASALAGCNLPTGAGLPGGPVGSDGFAITQTNADPATINVAPGQTITLSVTTSSPATSYDWQSTGGYLSSNTGNPVTWTAPSTSGSYTIGVTASNGSDSASASYQFNVD